MYRTTEDKDINKIQSTSLKLNREMNRETTVQRGKCSVPRETKAGPSWNKDENEEAANFKNFIYI